MCGIAGMIDFTGKPTRLDNVNKMLTTMSRRGPDQNGSYSSEGATLLHARLSVMDPERGRQPFLFGAPDGNQFALVYNGELYNAPDLRVQLQILGHSFQTNCDTEVVLHSYMEWKEECVKYFNGIFAFAVWEKAEKRLFVARDRIGVKPFFYTRAGEEWVFGSELKTLLAHDRVQPKIDKHSVLELLLVGPGRTPGYGVFKNVEELKPATCGFLTADGLRTWSYWALEDNVHEADFDQTLLEVKKLVVDAIERQLVSDVPVCTFLSGGLDSSIISAVADRYFHRQGKQLHTFSVNYADNQKYFTASKFQPNSDEVYIKMMNDSLHAVHHNVILDNQDVADALYQATEARDLPGMADVDSSLMLFCKEVKQHATVALSGECADEIFGGYPWYRDPSVRQIDGFPWSQSTAYRASFLQDHWLDGVDPLEYVHSKYQATVDATSSLGNLSDEEQRMKEMVNLNFTWFMQTLLDRKDRMSMYNGLEVRVPFCDYRIAQYMYSVPWSFKDYQGREKGLLREAMKGLLPDEVLQRKKSPYPKTHNPMYLSAVSDMLRDVLGQADAPLLQLVKRESLEQLLVGDTNGANDVPWYGQLMTRPQTIAYMVQMNHWLSHNKVEID